MSGGPRAPARVVEPSLRHGDVGEHWGNLVVPVGSFAVGDSFRFLGEETPRSVRRVLAFPVDPSRSLVHYETTAR